MALADGLLQVSRHVQEISTFGAREEAAQATASTTKGPSNTVIESTRVQKVESDTPYAEVRRRHRKRGKGGKKNKLQPVEGGASDDPSDMK
jgi:hypothetical protein